MFQIQYNSFMSNLLKEKHALPSLRVELKKRPRKLCYGYKKFRHLACNYRNKRERERRTSIPQNRFEILSSRVIRYRVEIRRQERERKEKKAIWCFKCREEGH